MRGTCVIKRKQRKTVFHNVPIESCGGEECYSFRDALIMENYAQKFNRNDIGCFDFNDVVQLYKDISVEEMLGA